MTANWTQSRMISWVSYFWSCSPQDILYSITAHLTQPHQLTQSQHLSTGSHCHRRTNKPWHCYYDNVSPLQQSKHKLGCGSRRKEEDIHPFLQAHLSLWCWFKETFTLKTSHLSHSLETELSMWIFMNLDSEHRPSTKSHDAINHDHNQGRTTHTASWFLVY